MTTKNYTPINDLIKKLSIVSTSAETITGINKEVEPLLTEPQKIEIEEVVEYKEEKEVAPFVQKRTEAIKLPPDLQKLDLQPTPAVQFTNYQNLKLPISDDKIIIGLQAPITSSLRWLATLALYILRQAHLTLKVVHGHVVRVIKH